MSNVRAGYGKDVKLADLGKYFRSSFGFLWNTICLHVFSDFYLQFAPHLVSVCVGRLEDNPQVQRLLEGLTEPRKTALLIVTVYHSERI